jgi:hypothetical protein
MEQVTEYLIPFAKNLGILFTVVFFIYFSTAIKKTGFDGFSLSFWIEENRSRFTTGAVFILLLSLLMAVTDTAPLFHWMGIDINASPVALGLAIAVFLGFIQTKTSIHTRRASKAEDIQKRAGENMKDAAAIASEESKPKRVRKKPAPKE